MATVTIPVQGASSDNRSKVWALYITDSLEEKAVQILEQYAENFGFPMGRAPNPPINPNVGRLTMRRIYAQSQDGKVKMSFPCGDPTADIYREGGVIRVSRQGTSALLDLYVTGVSGEKRTFSRLFVGGDTGQLDGDA